MIYSLDNGKMELRCSPQIKWFSVLPVLLFDSSWSTIEECEADAVAGKFPAPPPFAGDQTSEFVSYQMNPTSYREALIETAADEAEGADILLVSGEYSMIDQSRRRAEDGGRGEGDDGVAAACASGEAGADIILTHFAR
uniref:Uncharacterized protein n=1 Tax=Oryza meridionalis TaxID=40149 RepID=A0A0E0CFA4_9ORYZ